jgi:anti-sigma factor RsiW
MEVKDTHVTADLSAYLDRELPPAEQARVSAHLEACRACSARLAELRATATLIAALPDARPSRSLVPALAPSFNWLRPVRSLSAVMSGAFVMVFLITAVAQSGSDLGGGPAMPFGRSGPAAGQPAAAPAAAPAPATEATAPALQLNAATPTPETFAATTDRTGDAEKREAEGGAAEDTQLRTGQGLDPEPPSPLIWLTLALALAIVAGVAHWRLRAAVA